MSVSTFYEVIPDPILNKIESDPDLVQVFEEMWGCNSGLHLWFQELDEEELEEITEELPQDSVNELKNMLENMEPLPSAYNEGTFHLHKEGIEKTLKKLGVKDSEYVSNLIISGETKWPKDAYLYLVNNSECKMISEHLREINIDECISNYNLEKYDDIESWREELGKELQELIECYTYAAENGHNVVLGCP